MQKLLRYSFSLDLRALALMRIAIGLVILLDLGIRVTDLEAFYADTGVTSREMIRQFNWYSFQFSFHMLSGHWQFHLLYLCWRHYQDLCCLSVTAHRFLHSFPGSS